MWRQNPSFSRNEEPDLSISDEDEESDPVTYDHGCYESLRSLYRHKNEAEIHVASRLEALAEEEELHGHVALNFGGRNTPASIENLESFSSGDDVEMDGFKNRDRLIQSDVKEECTSNTDEEPVSDEEKKKPSDYFFTAGGSKNQRRIHNVSCENQDRQSTWSAVLEEADELVYLHEKASRFSTHARNFERKKFRKGDKGKAKTKFTISSESYREKDSWACLAKGENKKSFEDIDEPAGLEDLECMGKEHSIVELLDGLQEGNTKLARSSTKYVNIVQKDVEQSIIELLDDLQENNASLKQASLMEGNRQHIGEKKFQFSGKRTLPPQMNSFVDDEDPLELRDSGSEDEENDEKSLFSATPKTKGQTMAALFQEAFNVDSEGALFPRSKHAGIGYHGRLQRVMQREKDRHTELLRQLQTGLSLNEQSKCLDVRILSRYLDAKLTVCHCILVEITKESENEKSTQEFVDDGEMSKRTIIFNSHLCADVGLEVGNVIHIHPPWMEVQTMENERIILVTYFSPG